MTSHSYNPFDFEFAKVQLFFQSDANSIHFFFYPSPFSRFNKGGKPLKEKISYTIYCQFNSFL